MVRCFCLLPFPLFPLFLCLSFTFSFNNESFERKKVRYSRAIISMSHNLLPIYGKIGFDLFTIFPSFQICIHSTFCFHFSFVFGSLRNCPASQRKEGRKSHCCVDRNPSRCFISHSQVVLFCQLFSL